MSGGKILKIMKKEILKIISLWITFIMLFVVGFSACDNANRLAEQQVNAIEVLQNYAESKGQENFTEKNWWYLQSLVITGKIVINNAINRLEVDTILADFKQQISDVPPKGGFDLTEIVRYFDLSDSKEIWDGCFGDASFIQYPGYWGRIYVAITFRLLKEGVLFPEINRRYFNLIGIRRMRILSPQNLELRYWAMIELTASDLEAVTNGIQHLGDLDFIKSARPRGFSYLPDFW